MSDKKTKEHLLELERQYWQAIKDKDAETAMKLSDDPCIVAGASGVATLTRDALGGMMRSATYALEAFELDGDAQVRMLGKDVALVAYKVHEKLTVDGQPVQFEAADASTWVKRDGRWVCALHTEALAGDPFGRDRHAAKPAA